MPLHPERTDIPGPGLEEYADKASADPHERLLAKLEAIVAEPDDTQWWPVQPYQDPPDDDEVVEVQVVSADRIRQVITEERAL